MTKSARANSMLSIVIVSYHSLEFYASNAYLLSAGPRILSDNGSSSPSPAGCVGIRAATRAIRSQCGPEEDRSFPRSASCSAVVSIRVDLPAPVLPMNIHQPIFCFDPGDALVVAKITRVE